MMTRRTALLLAGCLVACGSGKGGSGADASIDAGGGIDLAGAGSPSCPAAPPVNGAPCNQAFNCAYYLNCAADGGSDSGRVVATCSGPNDVWKLQSSACGSFSCGAGGMTCAADQICQITQGGAVSAHCIANPCGESAIACSCAPCSVGVCSVSGFTETCNTCPGGGCP
jgi:hypothetical protein